MAFSSVVYSADGIYRSPRPPVSFPSDPSLCMIAFLFRNADCYPNRLAIADADSGKSLTFDQLRSAVRCAAAGLCRLGIGKGSVVLIIAPNSLHFAVSFFAIIATGAVATTVNPIYTIPEISKQAKDSNAKLVITVPLLWDKVKFLGFPTVFFGPKTPSVAADSEVPIHYFSDLMAVSESEYLTPEVGQSDPAALLYSSGTTGTSKGVVLTHRNIICSSLMASSDQDLRGETHNTFLIFVPMFHVFGLSIITYAQLQRGDTLVVMARFEMEAMLRSIEKYRVTYLYAVPPVMNAFAKQGKATEFDLSSLRVICSGAAPLGRDAMEAAAKSFPKTLIIQGYGLTESCGVISVEFPQGVDRQYGSAGFLAVGVDGKVISMETQTPLLLTSLESYAFADLI